MKPISQLHYSKISWNQIARSHVLPALILTALLSLSTSLVSFNTAIAAPHSSGTARQERSQSDRLPPQVANVVRQDLSRRTGIAPGQLRITQSSQETWPNGCLGLAEPDQVCTQALVEGWRVVVSSGGKTWVYRTNATGSVVKLEPGTNQTSDAGTLKPIKIPTSELPPPLTTGVIFRTIYSGGITGRTYETVLMNDGRLMQFCLGDATDSERSIRRISPQQVRQFQQLLEGQQLSQFDRLNYPAPTGAADFITVTLTSSSSTIRYADIVQNNLPQPLQEVIQAWNQIASAR